jgi:hypothetical protein
MGDIQEDDGGTEGKASAQLLQPKTRSVAEGLLSRTRIPAKPLGRSVVWTPTTSRHRGGRKRWKCLKQLRLKSLVPSGQTVHLPRARCTLRSFVSWACMRAKPQTCSCGSHRVVANPPNHSQ